MLFVFHSELLSITQVRLQIGKKNMNASCPRVNGTYIWRILSNLGEGSDCLWQGLGLPKVAGVAMRGLIPSSDLTVTVRSCAALCVVTSLVWPRSWIFLCWKCGFFCTRGNLNGRGIAICVSTWLGPLYRLQGEFLQCTERCLNVQTAIAFLQWPLKYTQRRAPYSQLHLLLEESEQRFEPALCLEGNCPRFRIPKRVISHAALSDLRGFQVMMLSTDTLFPPRS